MQPIPTYEEATAAKSPERTSSRVWSQPEGQGLLGSRDDAPSVQTSRNGNYHAPYIETPRASEDSDLVLPEVDDGDEERGLRREIEEMETDDPARGEQNRAWLSKSFGRITHTFSSWRWPLPRFRLPTPSLTYITSRLPQDSPYDMKPSWSIFLRLFAIFLVVGIVYALMVSKIFTNQAMVHQFLPESLRSYVHGQISIETIEKYLYEISFDDHLAGTKGDFFLADWIEDRFKEANLDGIYSEAFQVYLNYPTLDGRRVAIVEPEESKWQAVLEEEAVSDDLTRHQTLGFHGHSWAGNVTGPLIYANYGSKEDFAYLQDQGLNVTGTIALVRYYGYQDDAALKVKAAEMAGAIGCLIYSDPADDGFVRGAVTPEGPWRTADSVQRGSVSLTNFILGDPLTPGRASDAEAERVAKDDSPGLVKIPSLPLAWRDAQVLLKALDSKGLRVPDNWIGGVPDTEWWTGNQSSPVVNLVNMQDEVERQPIRNVIGKIDGIEAPEKAVFIGNHRDAWCYGAISPGGGTAVFLEVVRVIGELIKIGWRPRRTIYFGSWDAGEFNMMGSTEHVEKRLEELRMHAVAYLNVDAAMFGPDFSATASPLLERPLLRVLDRVQDPFANVSLRQLWDERKTKLGGLGIDGDYAAFQDLAGCSSIDFGFRGEDHSYPYHSCYESFAYTKDTLDPNFAYHATLVEVWVLLILELVDEPVLGMDFTAYAREVQAYIADLRNDVSDMTAHADDDRSDTLNFTPLEEAAQLLQDNGVKFMEWEDWWRTTVMSRGMTESRELGIRRLSHNARMSNFETHLLDLPPQHENRTGGVPGREQFKHVIFGPQAWSLGAGKYFPAVRDALENGDWTAAQAQLEIVARVLHHAADKLLN